MKGFPIRHVPSESMSGAAKAVAKRQAEQLTLVRRRAQPAAVYITRMTLTAVFAYLVALQLPGGSVRSVLAPLTALLVVQATLFHTIRSAVQRVIGVTAGVLAAVAVSAYIPFSWWVLGLLIAGTLALGLMLRLHEDTVDSHAAATSRITETLVGAAAGLAAGLLFAPLRVQPARDAIGELSRQMGDLLGRMADGLAEGPDPRRAAEWLDRTRALRGEIERVDDALSQAEESVRLNPRRFRYSNYPNPAAGLRDGVDTLERAATDLRVLARAVADSARLDSEDSPVKDPETRIRLAAVIAELAASVRAYGQLIETDPEPLDAPDAQAEPIAVALGDHLQEAQRQQDRLADVLATDPAKQPDGWPLRGEILAHVDRLRSELEPRRLTPPEETRRPPRMLHHRSRTAPPRRGYRAVLRSPTVLRSRAGRTAERVRARLRALAAVVDGRDVQGEGAQVEVEGGLDVASLQADVIEHGWSLTTGYDTLPW
jgi:gas vesicle protein